MAFAGSAIAQNAGRLDNFDSWRPGGPQETKWLLMAGATDPPCETSTRRTRNVDTGGSFLRGVTNDLATMEASEVVKTRLHNAVRDYYLEKDEARAKIKKFFSICKRYGCKPILYYTCHGHCPLDRLEQAIGVLPMATEMAMARSAFRRLRRTLLADAATLLSSLMPVIADAGPTSVKRKSCKDSSVLRLPLSSR